MLSDSKTCWAVKFEFANARLHSVCKLCTDLDLSLSYISQGPTHVFCEQMELGKFRLSSQLVYGLGLSLYSNLTSYYLSSQLVRRPP